MRRRRRADKEEQGSATREARVWFRGLQAIAKKVGIKAIYDLSATPFYLKGSGYNEGYIFPWTVSDFSLMDAIESGIVKVPRIPVDDDADGDQVTYLRLWDYVGTELPKRTTKKLDEQTELDPARGARRRAARACTAATSERVRALGEGAGALSASRRRCSSSSAPTRSSPSSSTTGSPGEDVELDDGRRDRRSPASSPLLSNVDDGALARPRRARSSSTPRSSSPARRWATTSRRPRRTRSRPSRHEYRRRNPGADVEKLTDEDLLREVMNTVGKKGRLGEHVRCVVSVSMLTEGWDANTVTHILGIRAFGSQLLCEQVVGRGLRRRSYAVNDEGRFEPEYANVYGVPFAFIPGDRPTQGPAAASRRSRSAPSTGASDLRITFPKLDGYRVEIPDDADLHSTSTSAVALHVDAGDGRHAGSRSAGVVGEPRARTSTCTATHGRSEVAYEVADRSLVDADVHRAHGDARARGSSRSWSSITREWLDAWVTSIRTSTIGHAAAHRGAAHRGREAVYNAIIRQAGNRQRAAAADAAPLRPGRLDRRRVASSPARRHRRRPRVGGQPRRARRHRRQHVGADPALQLEQHRDVTSYVKNDHLGFTIPYVHEGRTPPLHARLPRPPASPAPTTSSAPSSSRSPAGRSAPARRAGQGRHRPRPVVRRGQQPRRLRPLGLRRDHRHAHVARHASTTRSRTCTPTGPSSATPTVERRRGA